MDPPRAGGSGRRTCCSRGCPGSHRAPLARRRRKPPALSGRCVDPRIPPNRRCRERERHRRRHQPLEAAPARKGRRSRPRHLSRGGPARGQRTHQGQEVSALRRQLPLRHARLSIQERAPGREDLENATKHLGASARALRRTTFATSCGTISPPPKSETSGSVALSSSSASTAWSRSAARASFSTSSPSSIFLSASPYSRHIAPIAYRQGFGGRGRPDRAPSAPPKRPANMCYDRRKSAAQLDRGASRLALRSTKGFP